MDNPFSWDYLTTVPGPDQVFEPFGIAFLVVFGLGFLASLVLYNDGAKRYVSHGLKRRTIQRIAGLAMIVFGIGLFFFAIRLLQINPFTFGMRLWLWISILLLIGFAVAVLVYLRKSYAKDLRDYEARRLRHQYTRPAALKARGRQDATIPLGKRPVRRRARR